MALDLMASVPLSSRAMTLGHGGHRGIVLGVQQRGMIKSVSPLSFSICPSLNINYGRFPRIC